MEIIPVRRRILRSLFNLRSRHWILWTTEDCNPALEGWKYNIYQSRAFMVLNVAQVEIGRLDRLKDIDGE
jgi:hypothetical protein